MFVQLPVKSTKAVHDRLGEMIIEGAIETLKYVGSKSKLENLNTI
jgi:hypothetical protein